jgi:mRNA interferase MazF
VEAGDVIRWAFVQADGKSKLRPAVLLKQVPPFNDWIICAVSSQLHRFQPGLDILLDAQHPDLARAGLPFASIIRTGYLTTIPQQQIEGVLGRIGDGTLNIAKGQLREFLR